MSPENAKVFFVDDNELFRSTNADFLEMYGHTVVETAGSLTEALDKVPGLGKKGINVALVDGNLTKMDTSGSDGEKVASAIKRQHPKIIVIGVSSEKPIKSADINCVGISGKKLAKAVTNA